jgi:hypothetical protein
LLGVGVGFVDGEEVQLPQGFAGLAHRCRSG